MGLKDELSTDVKNIIKTTWDSRDGTVVPTTETVSLTDGLVNLNATMLYADLADSTELAMSNKKMTAKIYKAFLSCSSKLIKANGGEIRSFDGDRVMGIFVGNSKNSNSAKCALQINYTFLKIIKPNFDEHYDVLKNGTLKLAHCVGIDTGEIAVVRGGIRNDNDLLWVGRAPNVAAKLSSIRNSPFHTYITAEVYNALNETSKFGGEHKENMWEVTTWKEVQGISTIYRSSWWWTP